MGLVSPYFANSPSAHSLVTPRFARRAAPELNG